MSSKTGNTVESMSVFQSLSLPYAVIIRTLARQDGGQEFESSLSTSFVLEESVKLSNIKFTDLEIITKVFTRIINI